jgi:hypothetical protein
MVEDQLAVLVEDGHDFRWLDGSLMQIKQWSFDEAWTFLH